MPSRKVDPDHVDLLKHALDVCKEIAVQTKLSKADFLDLFESTYRKMIVLLAGK